MTSERQSASLIEIETQWSIDDLFDANAALDIHDELHRLANIRGGET